MSVHEHESCHSPVLHIMSYFNNHVCAYPWSCVSVLERAQTLCFICNLYIVTMQVVSGHYWVLTSYYVYQVVSRTSDVLTNRLPAEACLIKSYWVVGLPGRNIHSIFASPTEFQWLFRALMLLGLQITLSQIESDLLLHI